MLSNLSIKYKLLLSFGAIIFLVSIAIIFGRVQSAQARDAFDRVTTEVMPTLKRINDVNSSISNIRRYTIQLVYTNEESEKEYFAKQNSIDLAKIDKSVSEIKQNLEGMSPEQNQKLIQMLTAIDKYLVEHNKLFKSSEAGEDPIILQSLVTSDLRVLYRNSFKIINEELAAYEEISSGIVKEADRVAEQNKRTVIIAIIAILALTILVTHLVTKSIVSKINVAVDAANQVATGDLAFTIPEGGKDELGQLLKSLGQMQTSLATVVKNVREGSEGVSTASAEIASGNHDLSSRTESQASALEETAASMEELSSTVSQNADSAKQANQLAVDAAKIAGKGGEVVALVVETMKSINDSSKKITDIISVIDGIAFQTNILALNAAVEAARAGEQGRGFAVVASEVRSLAGRSATAAKEIKTLIGESTERVTSGVALADEAGQQMSNVVESIKKVADIVGEISVASREQAEGVAQVGEAVTQMDTVTQQNAALVEQMAAAASSLKTQAEELVTEVSHFKISGSQASVVKPKPLPVARVAIKPPVPYRPKQPANVDATPFKFKPTPTPPKAAASEDWETF